MKKSKRLILFVMSMVLVLSMALGGIMTVNAADSSTDIDNTYRIGLLEALKISKVSGVGVSEWTGNLTRGEAAFLIAGLIQLDRSTKESIFDDVSTEAFYAGSVASLNEAGIVLKSWGSKKFKPDEAIEYGEFLTMLCKALGYMGYAESKGGYPVGYISVAKQFKITSGVSVSTSGNLDKKYVPKLLMNALDAYYLGISGIDKDGNTETEKRGIVLNDYFDTYTYKGILAEVGPFSTNNNYNTAANQIVVGDYLFNISKTPLEYYDLLGQQVTVYYKEVNDTVYIYPDEDNSLLKIDADDLRPQTTADVIKYLDSDGDEVKAKLASGYTTIYNGTMLAGANLEPVYGNLTLVDNDGDNRYDFVKVTEYQLAKVVAVDSYNKIITFDPLSNDDNNFDLDIEETENFKITGTNGKNIKATAVAIDDIVLYAVNQPRYAENLYYDFILSKSAVEGTISAIGSEEIAVDNATYLLSGLTPEVDAAMGDHVTVHVDAAGKVFYIETEGYNYKDAKYAIYLSFEQIKGGSKPQWEIELFTQDGARVCLPVAEKVKINGGSRVKITETSTQSFFEGLEVESMIKYNIANGELTEILTPDDWGTSYQPWKLGQGFNKFNAGERWWRTSAGGMFASWLPLASDAIRFYIAHDENGAFDEEKSQVSTARMLNDQNAANLILWDLDKSGRAHAYMATPQTSENLSTGSGSNNNPMLAITKVIESKDVDGIPGKYVFGLMNGVEKQFWMSSEDYADCGIANGVNPFVVGNVVKIRTNGSNIVGIMRNSKNNGSTLLCYTKAELEDADVNTGIRAYEFANPNVRSYYSIIAKVLIVEDGLVHFVQSESMADATTVSKSFCAPVGGTVYKFDPDGEDLFTVVSWNDVRATEGMVDARSEINGSTVLINVCNFAITDVFILD